MGEPIITFRNVSVAFDTTVVHRDISFEIRSGETITILGPSGTGKTVILKLIIGLLQATSGEIIVHGKNVPDLSEYELTTLRQNIGMLFQGAALFDSLTVYDNIAYSLRESGNMEEDEIAQIVQEKLDIIDLPKIERKYPPELSGGQKKRVALARALASSPQILLYDEPTTGLDPTAIRMIDELILKLKTEFGITQVVVTHDIESARRVSDRWILISEGKVTADGPVAEVSRTSEAVRDFIGGNWQSEIRLGE